MNRYKFVDYATQGYIAWVAVLVLIFHGPRLPAWPWVVLAHIVGFGLIHALIRVAGAFSKNLVLGFFRNFYPILLYLAFYRESEFLNQMCFSGYWDGHFLKLESELFGMQPGLELMMRFPSRWVAELMFSAYFSFYLMIGGLGLALLWRDRRQFAHFVSVVSFVFYVCYTIYIFVPVVGPRVVGSGLENVPIPQEVLPAFNTDIPASVQDALFFRLTAWVYGFIETAGAAFPSSHVAVAFCTVYFSFLYLRPIRYVHLVVAILLCISTVYGRYHYVVDAVAGVAVAVVLLPIGNRLYFKFENENQELSARTKPADHAEPLR